MCIRVHSPEMKYTKRSATGYIFQCSFTGNGMYKTKLPLFASKEKHVGKNTIYSNTRTLIGQKNFTNLRLTDKTFFLANTLKLQFGRTPGGGGGPLYVGQFDEWVGQCP